MNDLRGVAPAANAPCGAARSAGGRLDDVAARAPRRRRDGSVEQEGVSAVRIVGWSIRTRGLAAHGLMGIRPAGSGMDRQPGAAPAPGVGVQSVVADCGA